VVGIVLTRRDVYGARGLQAVKGADVINAVQDQKEAPVLSTPGAVCALTIRISAFDLRRCRN
jgi:hypothetical protein